MKTYDTITDFLTAHLFSIDEVGGYFFKYYAPNQRHEIPFTALAGHTVESFQSLAEQKGWVEKREEQKGILRTVTFLPAKPTVSVKKIEEESPLSGYEETKKIKITVNKIAAEQLDAISKTLEIFGQNIFKSFLGAAPAIQELGKLAQVAGLYRSPLVQMWCDLAWKQEKERLAKLAREQADPDGHYSTNLRPWVIAAVSARLRDGQFTPEELEHIEHRESENDPDD